MLKIAAYTLYFAYTGLAFVAGVWGALGNAAWDHTFLFDLEVDTLGPETAASMLSQYRFLRAIEAGYGAISLFAWRTVLDDWRLGRLFLAIMTFGVVARVVSLGVDGTPGPLFFVFLGVEAVGIVAIYLQTKGARAAMRRAAVQASVIGSSTADRSRS